MIHDVEIASTSRDAKKRPERPDAEDKKGGKTTAKRGNSRSLLTKTKPNKKGKCVLCDSATHNVRSHHMDKHGVFALDEVNGFWLTIIDAQNALDSWRTMADV